MKYETKEMKYIVEWWDTEGNKHNSKPMSETGAELFMISIVALSRRGRIVPAVECEAEVK